MKGRGGEGGGGGRGGRGGREEEEEGMFRASVRVSVFYGEDIYT